MRLYLSSYQFGPAPERFADMVGGRRRGWLVMNALDASNDHPRRDAAAAAQVSRLGELGLEAEVVDVSRPAPSGRPDFLWVHGGNTFVLRAALARSGLDRALVELLKADEIAYGGFSAGACLLSPTLRGLEVTDPAEEAIAVHGQVQWDGLGVLDRLVVPHVDSDHPESPALTRLADELRQTGTPLWALRDGQALVSDARAPAGLTRLG